MFFLKLFECWKPLYLLVTFIRSKIKNWCIDNYEKKSRVRYFQISRRTTWLLLFAAKKIKVNVFLNLKLIFDEIFLFSLINGDKKLNKNIKKNVIFIVLLFFFLQNVNTKRYVLTFPQLINFFLIIPFISARQILYSLISLKLKKNV